MTERERHDRERGPGPERPADPESGLPEPVAERAGADRGEPLRRDERAATATERPHGGASGLATALTAILPGAGHLLMGAPARGMAFLLPWGALLAAVWLGWEAVTGVAETGSLDDWIAIATLVLGLAAVWLGAMRDLRAAAAEDARRDAARHAGDEPGVRDRSGDSQWSIAARHFRRNGAALAGLALVVVLYLVAFLAPLLAPFDPIAQGDLTTTGYLSPDARHWLGTDQFGRDILSRIIYGARISLAIGFIAVAIAILLGTFLGAVAGYLGGKIDAVIMRFTDMVMAFPRLVLLILVIALFDPSLTLIILVLGLTQWPGTARLVRGEVLSLREQEYIQAARALGFGRWRIIFRHLIPNVLAPVIVAATLGIGNTIVLEAGLSFLGMGVQPPTPSWGTLVADGRQNLIGAWWIATFPGLAIVVTVLAFNLVGDGLRDALDPRQRS
ncbi:MAG TPA: oligopeptide ABC transporter permease [Longimicrobiales bacterium]|nr:oligopeptide ABC transporter permease [Longimicrobiales bacterium]